MDSANQPATLALPLDPVELSAIPVPSTLQIRKDLQRESLRVNGLLCNGASGFVSFLFLICSLSNVRKTLFDVIGTYVTIDDATDVRNPDASKSVDGMQSTCTDSSDTTLPIDQILESISRTRIGEYCYNLLCTTNIHSSLVRCFPLQSSALILKVDNTESIPIDLNLNCALFKEGNEWKWGLCTASTFVFSYSVVEADSSHSKIIDINDVTNQHEDVLHLHLTCQTTHHYGLEEFSGSESPESGIVTLQFEYGCLFTIMLSQSLLRNSVPRTALRCYVTSNAPRLSMLDEWPG